MELNDRIMLDKQILPFTGPHLQGFQSDIFTGLTPEKLF